MAPIVLWGATGQARVLAEFLGALGFEIVALVDNDPAATSFLADVPLVHGMTGLRAWRAGVTTPLAALVAIGGGRGDERLAIQRDLAADGFALPIVVHPRAFVAADATIGAGSQILALAGVCAGATLGAACIVNTAATVDHECHLGDGVHVAPGAHLAGNVTVGDGAFIGTGASIIPRITIGAGATVGAGAVVVADVAPHTVVMGNPARVRAGAR